MTAIQSNLIDTLPVRAFGVRGVNSKPFERTFRSMKALNKFVEDAAGDISLTHIEQAGGVEQPETAIETAQTPAPEVVDLTETAPEGNRLIEAPPSTEPGAQVIELATRRGKSKPAPAAVKETKAPGRLKQLFDEWNSLVPVAEGLGLRAKAIRSLHENVGAGEKRVAGLRAQITEAQAAAEQAQA